MTEKLLDEYAEDKRAIANLWSAVEHLRLRALHTPFHYASMTDFMARLDDLLSDTLTYELSELQDKIEEIETRQEQEHQASERHGTEQL